MVANEPPPFFVYSVMRFLRGSLGLDSGRCFTPLAKKLWLKYSNNPNPSPTGINRRGWFGLYLFGARAESGLFQEIQ